jgi:hypothetical protein
MAVLMFVAVFLQLDVNVQILDGGHSLYLLHVVSIQVAEQKLPGGGLTWHGSGRNYLGSLAHAGGPIAQGINEGNIGNAQAANIPHHDALVSVPCSGFLHHIEIMPGIEWSACLPLDASQQEAAKLMGEADGAERFHQAIGRTDQAHIQRQSAVKSEEVIRGIRSHDWRIDPPIVMGHIPGPVTKLGEKKDSFLGKTESKYGLGFPNIMDLRQAEIPF